MDGGFNEDLANEEAQGGGFEGGRGGAATGDDQIGKAGERVGEAGIEKMAGIIGTLAGGAEGIDFGLRYSQTGKDDDWRWAEQWLPHAAWYLVAISIGD